MRNMRIYTVLVGLTLLLAACTSYEDAFNRNLDSTGLYVTNSSSNTVSQFAADPKSGILNDLGTIAAGTTPVYVAVNAAGTFAYVVNSGSNDVYVYSINTKTRKLAFASSVATGTLPRMIGLHSGGKFAYVVNETSNTISGYSVDATTGGLTALGAAEPTGVSPSRSMTIVTGFNSYLIIGDADSAGLSLFTINTTTGALVAGATDTISGCNDAQMLAAKSGTTQLIYAACSNGQAGAIGVNNWPGTNAESAVAAGTNPVAITTNPDASYIYVSNAGSNNISIFSANIVTLTLTGTISTCTTPGQMLINSSGFGYLVCNGDNTVRAYTVSGASLSLIKSYPVGTAPTSVAAY